MLRVSLLGSFAVSLDEVRIHSELGPSGQRMAAYLFAFPGRLHRREKLADLFWPEIGLYRSRAALNSAIWRIRKLLAVAPESNGGENLRTIDVHVVLDPEPWLEIDIHKIDKLLADLRREGMARVDANRRWTLQSAVDLYSAPLLEQAEEQVFLEERERIHTNFVSLAEILVRSHVAAGAYGEALNTCRRVLAIDPFRELFVRFLLVLDLLSEQRASAIRFFGAWREALRREMGVEPMPGTTSVFVAVRDCRSTHDIDALETSVFGEARYPQV